MCKIYIDLENLLKEKAVSKNALCKHCNLQRTQLNNYCKNKISRIDLSILARICTYLDCTLDYTEVETMPKLSFKHRKYHRFPFKISA